MKIDKIYPSIMTSTEKLKELINKYPDYPICVCAGEDANIGDNDWMLCTEVSFEVGEILNAEYYDDNEEIIIDRDRLEEVIEDRLYGDYEGKELDAKVKEMVAELEPYWEKCIIIYATN